MITVRFQFWGIVQGVGFRPFLSNLAMHLKVRGQVRNLGSKVELILTGYPWQIKHFEEALASNIPPSSMIVSQTKEIVPFHDFSKFSIVESGISDESLVVVPPDQAICQDCLHELYDIENRRYAYPFISCATCGPRYSIIEALPYDRVRTSMKEFDLCPSCFREYSDSQDRRYHAEALSCQKCGPILKYWSARQDQMILFETLPILEAASSLLLQGGIVGLKGMGGYYLSCSPFHEQAVRNLRKFKIRDHKPFAIMFLDLEQIKTYCRMNQTEESLLISSARPIVLLEKTFVPLPFSPETFGTSERIGAFLPSMGLQYLLLERCGPLIMTSANHSDHPILKNEEDVISSANPLLDAVLYNERRIQMNLDDSVLQVIDGQAQMIRRSKGYAPLPLEIPCPLVEDGVYTGDTMLLATGGHMKSAFCLVKGTFAYLSHSLGDLCNEESCENYQSTVTYLEKLFHITPKLVVCDLHPQYFTTDYAKTRVSSREVRPPIELLQVQHHHAHIASVIAEHGLRGPVIGVAMDGTGLGRDHTVWGGEFLLCQEDHFQRVGHLESIAMLGGDGSMKEAWKSAMCYLHHLGRYSGSALVLDPRYSIVVAALEHQINTISSSSMGRLFDAMAAFLGIGDFNHYEGECAMRLEAKAFQAFVSEKQPYPMEFSLTPEGIAKVNPIFEASAKAIENGVDTGSIALGFHHAAARMITHSCRRIRETYDVNQVALSGGVFQNKVLTELTLHGLHQEGFQVYVNRSVPPNDGGICLGQAYLGMIHLQRAMQPKGDFVSWKGGR